MKIKAAFKIQNPQVFPVGIAMQEADSHPRIQHNELLNTEAYTKRIGPYIHTSLIN